MSELGMIVILTGAAGGCIPLGGMLAYFEHIQPDWLETAFRHFLIAFGGGILLGAVAVVLVPEGIENMGGSLWAIPLVLVGGIVFFVVERILGLQRRGSPQVMGMLLDYFPEAMALGGLVVSGSSVTFLLALLMGLQNLPEGFNAYRELIDVGHSAQKTLLTMCGLVLTGPLAGLIGFYFLSAYPMILGAMMLFASGGILYLIFQDIAPQARLDKYWAPPLGAVLGFCLALFSNMLVAQVR